MGSVVSKVIVNFTVGTALTTCVYYWGRSPRYSNTGAHFKCVVFTIVCALYLNPRLNMMRYPGMTDWACHTIWISMPAIFPSSRFSFSNHAPDYQFSNVWFTFNHVISSSHSYPKQQTDKCLSPLFRGRHSKHRAKRNPSLTSDS